MSKEFDDWFESSGGNVREGVAENKWLAELAWLAATEHAAKIVEDKTRLWRNMGMTPMPEDVFDIAKQIREAAK